MALRPPRPRHLRIDILRQRAPGPLRALLDLLALGALAAVAIAVSWHGWKVLSRSLANASRANTPLETPLWIPQVVWWSGWVWFAAVAVVLWAAAAVLLARGDVAAVEAAIGPQDETEDGA